MMDLRVLLLQIIGLFIWTGIMVPALILVSKIFLFYFIFSNLMADNADPTQFDPRAQAMEEVHFDWRCIVCYMVALSPFTWSNSISLALNLFILTLITPHGLNVTSVIPPFICSVGPGNQFMLLDPDIFFVPSFVVGGFRYPYPSLCRLILIDLFSCRLILIDLFSCCLKMAHKAKCLDTLKGTKKPGD